MEKFGSQGVAIDMTGELVLAEKDVDEHAPL